MNQIGNRIKEIRLQSGLRQKEFAESMTVTQPYISRVENGKEIPTPMFLKLFCLQYSVDEVSLKN